MAVPVLHVRQDRSAAIKGRPYLTPVIVRIIALRASGGGNAVMEVIAVAAGFLLLIGFICGYGIRELISRHRHAKARRRHLDRMLDFERMLEEIRAQRLIAAKPADRLAIQFQRGDGAQPPSEGGAS